MHAFRAAATVAQIAFVWLQVLSTLYAAESVRGDQDRNILEVTVNGVHAFVLNHSSYRRAEPIVALYVALYVVTPFGNALQLLSNNTRRTKVVELSSGTHRCRKHVSTSLLSVLVPLPSKPPSHTCRGVHINSHIRFASYIAGYLLGTSRPGSERQHALSMQTLSCTLRVWTDRPCYAFCGVLPSADDRVPDELKRHSLTDKFGSQYSTNLDRNRYGTDNQYLSTVIRYDLDYLNLCPCLIDVEIIDAKNGNGTVIVSAGDHACSCSSQPVIVVRQLTLVLVT